MCQIILRSVFHMSSRGTRLPEKTDFNFFRSNPNQLLLFEGLGRVVTKVFDYEYEDEEAEKFRALASAFQGKDLMDLMFRFSLLADLCDEKAKVLRGLCAEMSTDERKSSKVVPWPAGAAVGKNKGN